MKDWEIKKLREISKTVGFEISGMGVLGIIPSNIDIDKWCKENNLRASEFSRYTRFCRWTKYSEEGKKWLNSSEGIDWVEKDLNMVKKYYIAEIVHEMRLISDALNVLAKIDIAEEYKRIMGYPIKTHWFETQNKIYIFDYKDYSELDEYKKMEEEKNWEWQH